MRVIQKLKIQNGLEEKGNHPCEGGNTIMSSTLPFPPFFLLHLKKHLAGQKFHVDEEVKNEDST